jgi:peptidyl-prolyl cis-trans isomerase C
MKGLLIVSLLGLMACQSKPVQSIPGEWAVQGEVLATADGVDITDEMLQALVGRMGETELAEMKARGQYQQLIERMVMSQMLYKKALDKGIHNDRQAQLAVALASREVLVSQLLEGIANEATADEALKKSYDEHKVQFSTPAVRAQHILVKEEALANELFAQVTDGGADFAALATQHSVDKGSAVKGGDLGWFEQGRMVKPFADAAFAADENQIVGPVPTQFGYHIIKVTGKRSEIPFEEARPKLEEMAKREAIEKFIEETKSSAAVVWTDKLEVDKPSWVKEPAPAAPVGKSDKSDEATGDVVEAKEAAEEASAE